MQIFIYFKDVIDTYTCYIEAAGKLYVSLYIKATITNIYLNYLL